MKQYNMDFGVTKSPAEILKEGAFGRKHFRKVFLELMKNGLLILEKNYLDPKLAASDFYDVRVNKHGVKSGTSLRFW